MKISEKPWSNYSAADYSIEQWHAACLIHIHDGDPTSKNQCKLPVRTPDGTVNRNGVHAAAAALAGARGGVQAPSEQKASAERVLKALYSQLDEEPPNSLKQSTFDSEFIQHYGRKGMKWGVRKASKPKLSTDAKAVQNLRGKPASALSNKQLKKINERVNLEQNYARMHPGRAERGRQRVQRMLATAGLATAAYQTLRSPAAQALISTGSRVVQGTSAASGARAPAEYARLLNNR